MGLWEAAAILAGAICLLLAGLAASRSEFEAEAPKYEMLGLEPPAEEPARPAGRLGPTDRIVRLGLTGALFYYAYRLGWGDPAGLTLAFVGTYVTLTGAAGRDPVYWAVHRRRS